MNPKTRAKMQLTIQGLINQFGFFLLLSSSKTIALHFDQNNLVSAIMFAANIASVTILFINALLLMRFKPKHRLIANTFIMIAGYGCIVAGWFSSFYLVVVGAIFTGTASAFGQVIHYGFIKSIPAEFVGPFSSGTGICGFVGSLIFLVLDSQEVPTYIIFSVMIPVVLFYLANFINLDAHVMKNNFFKEADRSPTPRFGLEVLNHSSSCVGQTQTENETLIENKEQTLWEGYKIDPLNHVWVFFFYIFEYTIITGFFDRLSQLRTVEDDGFFEKNLFTINQFLYQFGVLIARSSLYCVKSKATGLMTILLFILFIAFFAFCLFYVNVNKFIILALATLVGLIGGWCYVFSYYRVMDNKKLTKINREKLINYLAVAADFGSFLATGLATVLSLTILKVD
ncbi:unnamed protein product [Moneuplotes crassus]|uniref:Battenin n=1 Tax=Euplotes crassus TaxID=5936 RepID=A0AAD1UQK9_EUPCR|nr:unnamed protein product [Moneuplotes crassus]